MIASTGAIGVGLVLLFSGLVKALDLGSLAEHLDRYRLLSDRSLFTTALALVMLEGGLGTALVLGVQAAIVIPFAITLFVGLGALTLWAERHRGLDDCGCYGGVLLLTPKQSAVLDGVYVAALLPAWWAALTTPGTGSSPSAAWAVAGLALASGVLAVYSARRGPLVDFARLRLGRRWRDRWLPAHPMAAGRHFVVFLSRECPFCKRWVPFMNVTSTQADLPRVLGVVAASEAEGFRQDHLIAFPLAAMPDALFRHMVGAYPTAALIEDGVVVQTWAGEMPDIYFARAKKFLESVRSVGGAHPARKRFAG